MSQKAALYLRSSKDRSDVSIAAQRRELTALAQRRGYLVVKEFADVVESAKDDRRPAFRELLADLRSRTREWSAVLMLDPSRLSRNQLIAHMFGQDARKNNVQIVYAQMPAGTPEVDIILTPIMHALAEYHGYQSKAKGLAGMAENVRRGFRAGGRAPRGYQLEHIDTGAVRDGAPVLKSRLAPGPDAPQVAAYLRDRVAGVPRRTAAEHAGLKAPLNSLVCLEWNALTYAGHTAWGAHNDRTNGSYRGGTKRKPRSEWTIQRGTHEALIGDAEAETILKRLETSHVSRSRARPSTYVLGGMVHTPQGGAWHGDAGFYRAGAKKIKATTLEHAVVERVAQDLQADEFVATLTRGLQKIQAPDEDPVVKARRKEIASIGAKIKRLSALVGEMERPRPLLEKIDQLERDRERLQADLAEVEASAAARTALRKLTENDVRRILRRAAELLDDDKTDPERMRAALGHMLEDVVLDPGTLKCRIRYRIPVQTGVNVASPRGFEPRLPP
jgi:site-specific DNA recombinase